MNRRPSDQHPVQGNALPKWNNAKDQMANGEKRSPRMIMPMLIATLGAVFIIMMLGRILQAGPNFSFRQPQQPCPNVTDLIYQQLNNRSSPNFIQPSVAPPSSPPPPPSPTIAYVIKYKILEEYDIPSLRSEFLKWISHLRSTAPENSRQIVTQRTTCHELPAKGQTCVFEGLICINSTAAMAVHSPKPQVYIVNDSMPDWDGSEVPSDKWCHNRFKSSDPRYYSSRHWPILEDTVLPQHSCMEAVYRTSKSLFGDHGETGMAPRVKWVPSLALIDLDYMQNDHNTHLATDILWILDAYLYQSSLDMRARPGHRMNTSHGDTHNLLFLSDTDFYLPSSRFEFGIQTLRDLNSLIWAIILRKNPRKLYSSLSDEELFKPSQEARKAAEFLATYPELGNNATGTGTFHFHGDIIKDDQHDLVCTARLTSGVKTGFTTHERVCREIRSKTFATFGIERPPMKTLGQIRFPQPMKKVLVLNRDVSRIIGNGESMANILRLKLEPLGVEVSYMTTAELRTVEQWARAFSSAGIVISPHGSHNMGLMFMQRHSALIEIMPVGYTEYSSNLLSETCRVWHYEVPSLVKNESKEMYEKECGHLKPHMFTPCNIIKYNHLWVRIEDLYPTVLNALERIGYDTDLYLKTTFDEE